MRIDAADLVATAPAACPLADLHAALGARNVWLALDPPGPSATLGAALEAGTPGPLAALYGPPRDQVIGMTFVAGNNTSVKTGGRVVKNVAGFDLAKLVIGGHGAFGRIAEVHLRLRAMPEADITRAWSGGREALVAATARLMTGGAMLAACEVVSPALAAALGAPSRWTLLARAMGTAAGVAEELAAAAAVLVACDPVGPDGDVWARWREVAGAWPVAVRIGADPAAWSDAVALAAERGATAWSVTVPRGTVRAAFAAGSAEPVRALRAGAGRRGWPVTLERSDEPTRQAVGIWGPMEDGAGRVARALHAALGPAGSSGVPLWV